MRVYTPEDDQVFKNCLSEMIENPAIQKLKEIPQHKGSTTYAHCVNVANTAYALAKKWHWDIDIRALVRGAMLHDYYLYDTETMPYSDYRHSLVHPKLAVANAEKLFDLNLAIIRFFIEKTGIAVDLRKTEDFFRDGNIICEDGTSISCDDLRESIHPKKSDAILKDLGLEKPYFQVFAQKHGFISDLSIMDLLFNEGPDSILYLKSL